MRRRYLLVGNPSAQSGKNAGRIRRARWLLFRAGIRHRFIPTQPNSASLNLLIRALSNYPVHAVIAMGGDGTFAEVAKGILKAEKGEDVLIGILPAGTANDQGRSFGLGSSESELERNVQIIAHGNETQLDGGFVQGFDTSDKLIREDYFFDSLGWGISPRILQLRNEDRKAIESVPVLKDLWRDKWVYAGAALRTFLASYIDNDKFDARVRIDGERIVFSSLTDLIVKATTVYAGAWIFDKKAKPDDGKFEVVPFFGKRDWLSKAILHLEGGPLSPEALANLGMIETGCRSGSEIKVNVEVKQEGLPLVAQMDGEEFPVYPEVRIKVLPRALRLIVP